MDVASLLKVTNALRAAARVLAASDVAAAEKVFWEAVETIWSAKIATKLRPLFRPTEVRAIKGDVLSALKYAGRPWAIGDALVQSAARYTLIIDPRLLSYDDDFIKGIMIHEAVHIGYPLHNKEFRDMVTRFGGAVSESAARGEGLRVQVKQGARYQTVKTFDHIAEDEAVAWVREQKKQNPGARYRTIY